METLKLIGAIITLIGSIFIFLGALGLLRMPDFFTRIQAGTKASTLGTMLSILGIGIIHYEWAGKIIILIVFVFMTNPIASHVIARAAHFTKVNLTSKTVVDKLQEHKDNQSEKI
jgi:multicomponent Na+:H+ antiporter subunit G